jgi:hypothetical protein
VNVFDIPQWVHRTVRCYEMMDLVQVRKSPRFDLGPLPDDALRDLPRLSKLKRAGHFPSPGKRRNILPVLTQAHFYASLTEIEL